MADAFTSVSIGPVVLRNRFIRSGANEMMTHHCLPTENVRFSELYFLEAARKVRAAVA